MFPSMLQLDQRRWTVRKPFFLLLLLETRHAFFYSQTPIFYILFFVNHLGKKRIESQLGLLHARKAATSDSSQGHLKKVKKAPMKKAFKTKKLKKLSRAQIVADKVKRNNPVPHHLLHQIVVLNQLAFYLLLNRKRRKFLSKNRS